jgi:hypothetical protein
MNTANMFFGIVAFLMILFVYINEMKNITEFIIKYKSIKDTARINMEQKCKNIYCEAETDRFQIAKNMYDLLLPNDIYNARTYTTMVMIFSILLFIYVFYLYVNFLNGIGKEINLGFMKINDTTVIIFFLFIITFITLLTNILLRYVPNDEVGYMKYFVKEAQDYQRITGFHITMFIFIFGLLFVYIFLKKNLDFLKPSSPDKISFIELFFYFLYFIFAFYFMFTMVNIVEAFRKNVVPVEIYEGDSDKGTGSNYQKHWTADTAHDSENYFYRIYFKLQEIPKAIFSSFKDYYQNYNINDVYIFKNLPIIGLVLFVLCIIIALIMICTYFFSNDKTQKTVGEYISILLPLVFLFFVIFSIVMFTSFNTAFNKYALYGVCKSSYARALNGLNNVVVPFIAMHEKDAGTGNNNLTDYRYNYIVLNVIISYFLNYVNLITNDENYSNSTKQIAISAKLKKFHDKKYIDDRRIKFNLINTNDTTDLAKFEAYYKELFKEILEYENRNIPDNLDPTDIQSRYVNLLNKIFFNKAEMATTNDITVFGYDSKLIKDSGKKDTAGNDLKTNNQDLVNKIRNAVYYYISKLENFNINIGKYNDIASTDRDTFSKDFLFYINDDNTIDPYKFIMIKGGISSDATLNSKYDGIYNYKSTDNKKNYVDSVINVFLTHIRSLYKDIYDSTSGYNGKSNEAKVTIFNTQIKTSLKMLSTTQQTGTEEIPKTRENTDDKLEYLFQAFKELKIKVDSKANYLVNVIETISNELNNTDAEIKLYEVTQTPPTTLLISIKNDAKLSEISNLKTKVDNNDEIDGLAILDDANYSARGRFVLTYATNIIVLGIVYLLVSRTNR